MNLFKQEQDATTQLVVLRTEYKELCAKYNERNGEVWDCFSKVHAAEHKLKVLEVEHLEYIGHHTELTARYEDLLTRHSKALLQIEELTCMAENT